jgi:hypothetical protein
MRRRRKGSERIGECGGDATREGRSLYGEWIAVELGLGFAFALCYSV